MWWWLGGRGGRGKAPTESCSPDGLFSSRHFLSLQICTHRLKQTLLIALVQTDSLGITSQGSAFGKGRRRGVMGRAGGLCALGQL